MDDFRVLRDDKSDHPAHFDQTKETSKEILSRAEGWILFAATPPDDNEMSAFHVILGKGNQISTMALLEASAQGLRDLVKGVMDDAQEEGA